MSYMALYRKWRPQDFDEVRGQDAIVRTLRNQINYQRIGHAYLFCGTRGTGKTSIAKLFAKAVNCENPVNGNPCNTCPSCQAINQQSSMDVIEIDAASNNGVDNVREIREQVQYSPVSGRYKVYIIDEVHMLSAGAFNALLKTLEEPPSYVIFILATTEKHKIPITILSRCQKYDFKRISIDTITDHLITLMQKENIDAEQEALSYIARAADGSMRDALSLLDQCIAFYLGQKLTYDNVLTVLGTVDTSIFRNLLRNILSGDTSGVLQIIEDTINEGRELTQFLSDFLWYLRNLLILKDPKAGEDNLDMSKDHIAELMQDARTVETSSLLRYIRILSELSNQLRNATQKRILLEVGFIKLCQPQMEEDTGSLLERLRVLEEKIAKGLVAADPVAQPAAPATPAPASTGILTGNEAEQEMAKRFSPAEINDLRHIASRWPEIIAQIGPPMSIHLQKARIAVAESSNILQLIFTDHDGVAKLYFEQKNHENLDKLADMVTQHAGKRVEFQCIIETQIKKTSTLPIGLNSIHGIQVEIED